MLGTNRNPRTIFAVAMSSTPDSSGSPKDISKGSVFYWTEFSSIAEVSVTAPLYLVSHDS